MCKPCGCDCEQSCCSDPHEPDYSHMVGDARKRLQEADDDDAA